MRDADRGSRAGSDGSPDTEAVRAAVGQAGKDVVWVPTPQALVDKMLDMAKVTPQDFVMDLGPATAARSSPPPSAASRAMGIEYNPDMVELSKKNAAAAGVTDKATFVKADLFENRLLEGARHHDVPAALDQHEAAAEDPRSQAGHADRLELVHDGRLGAGSRPRPSPTTARAGARRSCGSCRRRSRARGRCRKGS